jgi:hypothetical protein
MLRILPLVVVSFLISTLAPAAPLLTPGDAILGVQVVDLVINVASQGNAAGANNWPTFESPEKAIDGFAQKHLNYAETNTGLLVTPALGSSLATSLTIWTANDVEARDPASYEVLGTNVGPLTSGGPFSLIDFQLLSQGPLSLPSSRNGIVDDPLDDASSQTVGFEKQLAYTSYLIVFPTVKDPGSANSMQIAEVQLGGEAATDLYTARVDEDDVFLASSEGLRAGLPLNVVDDYLITWIDHDTFQLDWFANVVTRTVVTLDGFDMTTAEGDPTPIIDVIKGDSGFCADPVVSFDDDTIVLTYDEIAPGDSECGDVRSFDIVTVPEPSGSLSLLAGTLMLVVRWKSRVGRRGRRA